MEKDITQIFNKIVAHGKQDAVPAFETTVVQKDSESYFEDPRNKDPMHYQLLDLSSEQGLSTELKKLWEGDAFMLSLVEPMAKVASELRKAGDSQSAELDSFIYVMY